MSSVPDDATAPDAAHAAPADAHPHPGYDLRRSIWGTLGERIGPVSLRPRLLPDVRVRRVGSDAELVQLSTGRVLDLSEDDEKTIRTFDGEQSIAEIIASRIHSGGKLPFDEVLGLVDRVARAGLLDHHPPDIFRQMENFLTRRAVELLPRYRARPIAPIEGEEEQYGATSTADGAEPAGTLHMYEQVPWRPRSPLLAERARFLRGVKLLRTLDSWAIGMLAEVAKDETFPAASNIVSEGDIARRFYIVRSGDVNVVRSGDDPDVDDEHADNTPTDDVQASGRRRIARLSAGDWFGEVGLLEGAQRNATVRVGPARPAQLYSFDADTFERLISPYLTNYRGRQRIARRRDRLQSFSLFSDLDQEALGRVAQAIREHKVPAQTPIFAQGDEGDKLYLVMDGSVGVVRDGVPVAKLTPGDFFGETALLFTPTRTASVITIDDAILWSVDKETFQDMIREHLLRQKQLLPTIMNRL